MIFSVSAVFVVLKVFASGDTEIAQDIEDDDPIETKNTKSKDPDDKPTPKIDPGNSKTSSNDGPIATDTPTQQKQSGYSMPAGKTYLDLSDTERRQYLSDRGLRIAQVIGNSSSDAIPPDALDKIKGFTDGYARRRGLCPAGNNVPRAYRRDAYAICHHQPLRSLRLIRIDPAALLFGGGPG